MMSPSTISLRVSRLARAVAACCALAAPAALAPAPGRAAMPSAASGVAFPGAGGVITDYTDPAYAVPWGFRSYWAQPWRSYLDTVPASTLRSAVGIVFNVGPKQAPDTARLLGDEGFRLARVEVPWRDLDYDDPSELIPTDFRALQKTLLALQANGITPLIDLNSVSSHPVPEQPGTLTLTAPAPRGARTLSVSPSSLNSIEVGRTGLTSRHIAAYSLITHVDASTDTVTLSRKLVTPLPAGPVSDVTLLYEPFAPPVDNGAKDPRFAQTLKGWTNYVDVVGHAVKAILGTDHFNVEVWNELSRGAQFLQLDKYYSPVPWTEPKGSAATARGKILKATVKFLRNPSHGLDDVGIGDGFANQTPFVGGSQVPPGTTAIDKHPYESTFILPHDAPVTGDRPLNALGEKSGTPFALHGQQVWRDSFTPTYDSFFPEFYLTSSVQTYSMISDLSPYTSHIESAPHGRNVAPPGGTPPQEWVTEVNLNLARGPVPLRKLTKADVRYIDAKDALRYLASFVNKGVSAFYLYAVRAQAMELVKPRFLQRADKDPDRYPGDRAGGRITSTVGRFLSDFGPPATISTPRRLSLQTLTDESGGVQFHGNGSTRKFPNLYLRDEFAFLPFQDSDDSFTVAAYIMTRDVEQNYHPGSRSPTRFDLPPKTYEMQIGGIDGPSAVVSATNPLTNTTVPVQIVARSADSVTVQMNVTDSPELLNIQDDGPPSG
jgi:hypothetical protein